MRGFGGAKASAVYAAIAVVMTWPVAANLGGAIAGDLADPVFNTWVLQWTSGQVLAFLGGDWGALGRYWHGNIFHPEPLTLAFSEHLTPQMLMSLPVMTATGNVLLAYNLLFISSFVLAGLGVFLFVRNVTGQPMAAFVAGLAFAWAPYRLAHISHLQLLTSFWMAFALVGFERYFTTRRLAPLVLGATALWLQNLSSGYFLLYFPPFLAAYCLYEMARRRLLGHWRVWLSLGAAALGVAALTWPFVEPYLALRAGGELGIRNDGEIRMFSADVWSLATAPPNLRLWSGHMSAFPKPEGEGFPGLLTATLALVAGAVAVTRGITALSRSRQPMPAAARVVAAVAIVVLGVAGAIGLWLLVAAGLRVTFGGTLFIFYNPAPALTVALVAALVLAVTIQVASPRAARAAAWPIWFFAVACAAAVLLSFGPVVMSAGKLMMPGPYVLLQQYVPGFDGSRVPARFLLVAALCLSILAGFGAAWLLRVVPARAAGALVVALSLGMLAESWIAPFRMNVPAGAEPPLVEPTEVRPGRAAGPLYSVVAGLPAPVVLIEFPFGQHAHDIVAMFYAGRHRRPLVNGYSGFFPERFHGQAGALRDPLADPERAARWLADTGATHAVVHEAYFRDDTGPAVSAWLTSLGARLMTSDGADKLFQLK